MGVMCLHLLLGLMEEPNSGVFFSLPYPTSNVAELVFVVLYSVDCYIYWRGMGRSTDIPYLLSHNKWKPFVLLAALLLFLGNCVGLGFPKHTGIRLRWLRPLFIVERSPTLRSVGSNILRSSKTVIPVLLLAATHVLLFSIGAFILFSDQESAYNEERYDGQRPLYFATIPDSIASMATLLATANNPDVMMLVFQSDPWASIFFVMYILGGIFFLVQLVLAIILDDFSTATEAAVRRAIRRTRTAYSKAYDLLVPDATTGISRGTWGKLVGELRPEWVKSGVGDMLFEYVDSFDEEHATGDVTFDEFQHSMLYFKYNIDVSSKRFRGLSTAYILEVERMARQQAGQMGLGEPKAPSDTAPFAAEGDADTGTGSESRDAAPEAQGSHLPASSSPVPVKPSSAVHVASTTPSTTEAVAAPHASAPATPEVAASGAPSLRTAAQVSLPAAGLAETEASEEEDEADIFSEEQSVCFGCCADETACCATCCGCSRHARTTCRRRVFNASLWMQSILDYQVHDWVVSELIFNVLVALNVVLVVLEVVLEEEGVPRSSPELAAIGIAQFCFLALFVLELSMKMFAYGVGDFWRQSVANKLDLILITASVLAEVIVAVDAPTGAVDGAVSELSAGESPASVASASRVFRLLRLLRALRSYRRVFSTVGNMLPVLSGVFALLLLMFYSFGMVGMDVWAGSMAQEDLEEAHPENPYVAAAWWGLNFDTLPRAMLVCLTFTVVNNFFVMVGGMGAAVSFGAAWAYFTLFYIVIVLIGVNVLIAIIFNAFVWYFRHDDGLLLSPSDRQQIIKVTSDGTPYRTRAELKLSALDSASLVMARDLEWFIYERFGRKARVVVKHSFSHFQLETTAETLKLTGLESDSDTDSDQEWEDSEYEVLRKQARREPSRRTLFASRPFMDSLMGGFDLEPRAKDAMARQLAQSLLSGRLSMSAGGGGARPGARGVGQPRRASLNQAPGTRHGMLSPSNRQKLLHSPSMPRSMAQNPLWVDEAAADVEGRSFSDGSAEEGSSTDSDARDGEGDPEHAAGQPSQARPTTAMEDRHMLQRRRKRTPAFRDRLRSFRQNRLVGMDVAHAVATMRRKTLGNDGERRRPQTDGVGGVPMTVALLATRALRQHRANLYPQSPHSRDGQRGPSSRWAALRAATMVRGALRKRRSVWEDVMDLNSAAVSAAADVATEAAGDGGPAWLEEVSEE